MESPLDRQDLARGFEYFVIRLSRPGGQLARVSGLVERLGSGEKRVFDTAEQLARLVVGWSTPGSGGDLPAEGPAPAVRPAVEQHEVGGRAR